jgi:AraC-like DNA-binding protein/mannose-6-phosphate isomerase-like protein (cupin superfamily)
MILRRRQNYYVVSAILCVKSDTFMERSTDHEFFQHVPRPVGAMAKSYPAGYPGFLHSHPRGQLLYAESGTMKVTTGRGTWMVPPHRAVWFPPKSPHQTGTLGAVEMRTLYIRRDACPSQAQQEPCVLHVSPLLRELVRAATAMPIEYDERGHDGRLIALLLEEIRWTPVPEMMMPRLRDNRLLAIEQTFAVNPSDGRTLEQWAALAGASARTLARLFQRETGMSFRSWREQFRAQASISRLMEGDSVTTLAGELGYETPSAFTAMFRRVMGVTPSRFLADSRAKS